MGLFDGCLLASDIDNTLIASGYINPRVIDAIQFFVKEGGYFALSTGRCPSALAPILSLLPKGVVGPSVIENGCCIYDFENDRTLYESTVSKEDMQVIYKIKERFPEVGFELYTGKKIYIMNNNQELVDHEEYEWLTVEEISCEKADEISWNKVLMASQTPEIFEEVKEFIKNIGLKESAMTDTNVVLEGRMRQYLEFWRSGINKATSLKLLCNMLNIKEGCYFAIGDYYNDLEMIDSADIGAATEDAPDDVKALAGFISCSAKDGAVADFIDHLTAIMSQR